MISNNGLDLIKRFEGYSEVTYFDPIGIPTIGYGTIRVNGKPVTMGMSCTKEDAECWLREHITEVAQKSLDKSVKVVLGQNQEDALLSFIYNVGAKNFENSTLLRLLNEGKYVESAQQLLRWNRAGGKVLDGLTKRRQAEMELFLS